MKFQMRFFAPLLSLLALLLLSPALTFANSQSSGKASIPFDFYVGNTKMIAGDYNFSKFDSPVGVLWVGKESGSQTALAFVRIYSPNTPFTAARLVFHKYGDRYFLAEIWDPILEIKGTLALSRAEKEEEKTIKEHQTSSNIRPELVAIAMTFPTGR